jgi:hypothetical protein
LAWTNLSASDAIQDEAQRCLRNIERLGPDVNAYELRATYRLADDSTMRTGNR